MIKKQEVSQNVTKLKIGTTVYLQNDTPPSNTPLFLKKHFLGPYEILILKNCNAVIRHRHSQDVVLTHVSKLKLIPDPLMESDSPNDSVPTNHYNFRPRT